MNYLLSVSGAGDLTYHILAPVTIKSLCTFPIYEYGTHTSFQAKHWPSRTRPTESLVRSD